MARKCRCAPDERPAFTVVELLVVVAIIIGLLALLTPALDRAIETTQRAVCSANLRTIHLSMTLYAHDNRKWLVSCKKQSTPQEEAGVQIAFKPDQAESLSTVGLTSSSPSDVSGNAAAQVQGFNVQRAPSKVWDCPSRPFRSQWEISELEINAQMVIGYQYLGGIGRWINPQVAYPGVPSRSPIKTNQSKPDWVLAADTTAKIDGAWGSGRAAAFSGMPSHRGPDGMRPAGGNQAHMDGAVGWFDYEQMLYIHSWTGEVVRAFFWHQRDLGGFVVTDGRLLAENN
jgi:type II secretory pathway pseudopilin PulG